MPADAHLAWLTNQINKTEQLFDDSKAGTSIHSDLRAVLQTLRTVRTHYIHCTKQGDKQ